jgi:hypothetical protein
VRRRALSIFASISSVLLLLTIALAIRTQFVVDKLVFRYGARQLIAGSFPRHVHFLAAPSGHGPDRAGLEIAHDDALAVHPRTEYFELRFGRYRPDGWYLGLPHWMLIVLTLPPPLWWLTLKLRERKRKRAGLCIACGYDLRESRERCPECGLEMRA